MSIIKRIKHLGLPLDQIIVIGSGLLDALELRTADDIDLVVTEKLFLQLSTEEKYSRHEREGEPYLTKDDVEIWMSWGNGRQPNFQQLKDEGVVIDGVIFVNKEFLIAQKKQSGRDKDISDISLLKGV